MIRKKEMCDLSNCHMIMLSMSIPARNIDFNKAKLQLRNTGKWMMTDAAYLEKR